MATKTFLGSAGDATDTGSYNFASFNLGTASADRYIYVFAFINGTNPDITAMTINGVAATEVVQVNNAAFAGGVWVANVPTGTTGTIAVTGTGTPVRCGIGAWGITGLATTTPANSSTAQAVIGVDSDVAGNIDVAATSFILAGGMTSGTAGGAALWTNLNEDADFTIESGRVFTYASYTAGAAEELAKSFQLQWTGTGSGLAFIIISLAIIVNTVGAAAGVGDAAAIGTAITAAVGAAAGTSTADAGGTVPTPAVGAASGVGDAAATATHVMNSVGATAGTGAASATATAVMNSVGAAAGVGNAIATPPKERKMVLTVV